MNFRQLRLLFVFRLVVTAEKIKNETSVWTKYEGTVEGASNPAIFIINLHNQQVEVFTGFNLYNKPT